MKSQGWAIAAGILAAICLALALWPQPDAVSPMVVAARDLGAGTVLQAADLEIVTVAAAQVPDRALADPAPLIGQTLSVVRFQGELVAPVHLGPAVTLDAHERGIAVRVQLDTGLAGLLQPGQHIGLVAVVRDRQGQNERGFAKALIENVRVLWISPAFRLRPDTFLPAGQDVDTAPVTREGIVVLAASTLPAPVLYETQTTLHVRAIRRALAAEAGNGEEDPVAAELLQEEDPHVVWGVPLEMLAALNHVGASFTLVMQPPDPDPYTTPGFSIERMLAPLLHPQTVNQENDS